MSIPPSSHARRCREFRQHGCVLVLAQEGRPVRQPVLLPTLAKVRDPQPRLGVGTRAAATAFEHRTACPITGVEIIREVLERFDRDQAAVVAERAGQ